MYLFLERGEGREKERDIDVQEIHRSVASRSSPVGDLARNPDECPNW